MSEHAAEPALTDPERKLPASPEAPDAAEPPGAAGLEADAQISLEPSPADALAKMAQDKLKKP